MALAVSACEGAPPPPPEAVGADPYELQPIPGCQEVFTPLEDPATGKKPGYSGIFNTESQLVLRLVAEGSWVPGSWVLESASVYAGTGPVPTNAAGQVDPALFPHQVALDGVPSRRVVLPLPGSCNDKLNVAIFVRFYREGAGGRETTSGWSGGNEWPNSTNPGWIFGIPLPGQGWYVQSWICCGADHGCARTQGYWKNHPAAWPVESLTLGRIAYTKAELLALLGRPPRRDASITLAHQLIAALLNTESSVTTPPGPVSALITAAQSWMIRAADRDGRLPYGVGPWLPAGARAVVLAAGLALFNEGRAGVPHCD